MFFVKLAMSFIMGLLSFALGHILFLLLLIGGFIYLAGS